MDKHILDLERSKSRLLRDLDMVISDHQRATEHSREARARQLDARAEGVHNCVKRLETRRAEATERREALRMAVKGLKEREAWAAIKKRRRDLGESLVAERQLIDAVKARQEKAARVGTRTCSHCGREDATNKSCGSCDNGCCCDPMQCWNCREAACAACWEEDDDVWTFKLDLGPD